MPTPGNISMNFVTSRSGQHLSTSDATSGLMSLDDQISIEGDNMILYHDSLPGKITLGLPTFLYGGTIKSSCCCPGNIHGRPANNSSASIEELAATSKLVAVMHPRSIALRFDCDMLESLSGLCYEKSSLTHVNRIAWEVDTERDRSVELLRGHVYERCGSDAEAGWARIASLISANSPCILNILFVSDTLLNNVADEDNVLSLFALFHGKPVGMLGWVNNVLAEAAAEAQREPAPAPEMVIDKTPKVEVPSPPPLAAPHHHQQSGASSCVSPDTAAAAAVAAAGGGGGALSPVLPLCRPYSYSVPPTRHNATLADLLHRPHSTVPVLTPRTAGPADHRQEVSPPDNCLFGLPSPSRHNAPPHEVCVVHRLAAGDENFHPDSVILPPVLPPRSFRTARLISAQCPPPLVPAPELPLDAAGDGRQRRKRRTKKEEGDLGGGGFLQLPVLSPGAPTPPTPPPPPPASEEPPMKKRRKRPVPFSVATAPIPAPCPSQTIVVSVNPLPPPSTTNAATTAVAGWGLPDKFPTNDHVTQPDTIVGHQPPPPPLMWHRQAVSWAVAPPTTTTTSSSNLPSVRTQYLQPSAGAAAQTTAAHYSALQALSPQQQFSMSHQARLMPSPVAPPAYSRPQHTTTVHGPPYHLVAPPFHHQQYPPHAPLQNLTFNQYDGSYLSHFPNATYDPSGAFRIPAPPATARKRGSYALPS